MPGILEDTRGENSPQGRGNFYDSFRGEENLAELSPAKNVSRQRCDSFCIPLTEFPLLRAGKGTAEPARASVDRKRVSPLKRKSIMDAPETGG